MREIEISTMLDALKGVLCLVYCNWQAVSKCVKSFFLFVWFKPSLVCLDQDMVLLYP